MSKNSEDWNNLARQLATLVAKNYNKAKSFGLEEDWRKMYFRTKAKCFRQGDDVALATFRGICFASETCISILQYEASL